MSTSTSTKVTVSTGLVTFGGSRIVGGVSAANLWSDGVVLATAWTEDQSSPIAGVLFTFRGRIERRPWQPRSQQWSIRHDDGFGTYFGAASTRRDAVIAVQREAQMMAFRALNQAQKESIPS